MLDKHTRMGPLLPLEKFCLPPYTLQGSDRSHLSWKVLFVWRLWEFWSGIPHFKSKLMLSNSQNSLLVICTWWNWMWWPAQLFLLRWMLWPPKLRLLHTLQEWGIVFSLPGWFKRTDVILFPQPWFRSHPSLFLTRLYLRFSVNDQKFEVVNMEKPHFSIFLLF